MFSLGDTINGLQLKIYFSLLEMQELLVSLKHVLGTDFKRGLFPLIDTLLDERYEAYEAHLKLKSFIFFSKELFCLTEHTFCWSL